MSEKNIAAKPENVAKEQATKEQGKPGILAKLPKPLAESIVGVATVALLAGCGMNTTGGIHAQDTREDSDTVQLETYEDNASEDELDGVESDVPDALDDEVADAVDEDAEADAVEEDAAEEDAVEEDAGEEDVIADVPAEDIEEEDAVEEDAPADVVDADTIDAEADTPVDVEVDDVVSDDVTVVCSALDETRKEWISNGGSETVGNVTVAYNGLDTSGNGLYDLLCGDVVVRSGIAVARGATVTVDVSEQGFHVALTANMLYSWGSNVTIEVNAH